MQFICISSGSLTHSGVRWQCLLLFWGLFGFGLGGILWDFWSFGVVGVVFWGGGFGLEDLLFKPC